MKIINSIKTLANNYDYFIFDVWGVVHDGTNAYKGAVDAITLLRDMGKKICFLSNAPRRAFKVAQTLNNFGINDQMYDFVMSSGEATYLDLEQNQNNNFNNFGQNYLYIGPKKDLDLLHGLNYNMVDHAKDADFAIVTGFDGNDSTLEEKLPQAVMAKEYNLPLICVNPDMLVVKQDGSKAICAGVLAQHYQKIGGKVIYYGKPYQSVYEITCKNFDCSNNSKILSIGDGCETDIKGANNFKIDSLLVTGGLISNVLKINHETQVSLPELEKICSQYQVKPQFVISNLKL